MFLEIKVYITQQHSDTSKENRNYSKTLKYATYGLFKRLKTEEV